MGAITVEYRATPVAMADREQRKAAADVNGNLLVSVASATGAPAGSSASPTITQSQGAGAFATGQAASSISPAAATQIVAARPGRLAVTVSNVTGTQPVYFLTSAAITGATTGFYLPAGAGASMTIPTSAAVFATSPTTAQTLSFLETF